MRRSEQRLSAVFACYQHELTDKPLQEVSVEREGSSATGLTEFATQLAQGALTKSEELDKLIAGHAENWSIGRIAVLDKCILRVALYEILYRDDIPIEVAIDEAVEIAKKYSGKDAPAFVNGILGTVVREIDKGTSAG